MQALNDGLPIIDAMKAALASDRRFDMACNIMGLIAANAIVECGVAENADDKSFTERV